MSARVLEKVSHQLRSIAVEGRKCSLLEFVDNRTGLEFLDETDRGVEEQQTADDTEIDPVLETSSHCKSKLLAKLLTPSSIDWRSCELGDLAPGALSRMRVGRFLWLPRNAASRRLAWKDATRGDIQTAAA